MKRTVWTIVAAWALCAPLANAQSGLQLQSLLEAEPSCIAGVCWQPEATLGEANLANVEKGRIIEVPSDGIEAYMPIATSAQGLPATIQGIWWMDGNPIGDILVTLGSSHYDPATRTAFLTTGDEGSYSFRKSDMTRAAYEQARKSGEGYVMQFDESFTNATIKPSLLKDGERVLISDKLVRFSMHLVEDGHWVRESYIFGIRIPDYNLRRVVRPDGTRDPAYADYLKQAGEFSYLLSHFD
ncbi:MAG: hypothetical protein NTZ90_01870 [Proteobacteria bacterium]|nr:hypothetical protein [Pseudomonadota bacterium]